MQGFVGEEENLERDTVCYREPVKILESGCDVLPGFRPS